MKHTDIARILIVDDQIHTLHGMSRIIGAAGYEVLAASNGQDCLRLAAEHKPDLILLDVALPDIDGREVCRQIKSNPETADIYVVLLSSIQVESDSQAEALEQGADGYIARPIPNRELLARVKSMLKLKNAENRLRESEERYHRISSITSDIAYSCRNSDDNGYAIDWMAGSTDKILGYSVDEIRALNCWRNLVVNEDLPVFDSHVTGLSPGISASCELRLRHKNGNIVWLSSFAQCLLEPGYPSSLRLYGGLVNITERKLAEEQEKRLIAAIEHTAEGIVVTDATGTIRYVNPAEEKISGYSKDELMGKGANVFKSDKHSEDFYKNILATINAGNTWSGSFINRRKDGTEYHADATISPVFDESGNLTNFVAVKHDVTKQIELQEQLFQAQKMEAIGTLAGGFAHDFNNKLQVIAGYVELILCNEELPENLKHDIDAIGQAVHASAELIREMLVFSRKTVVKFERINLNSLVRQLRSMLVPVMSKMITIDLVLAQDLWPINAAPNQIDQILMNLSVNARDAMPEGGKLIIQTQNTILEEEYCRYRPNTKPGRYVLLSVTDTGSGMDEATVKRIFEPFFTTKENDKGTGLGLSVVYAIVEKHGGKIICDSDPSVGTTFRIYFPAIEKAPEEQHPKKTESPKGQGETILLVDDEPYLVDIISRQLVGANYSVIKASNGKEALILYEKHREQISLVILDLLMPEMDGRQCLDALQDIDPSVRVLIATGHTTLGMSGELEQAGAKGCIRKPFETSLLLEEIRKVIDEK